jgi:hypothetical protein
MRRDNNQLLDPSPPLSHFSNVKEPPPIKRFSILFVRLTLVCGWSGEKSAGIVHVRAGGHNIFHCWHLNRKGNASSQISLYRRNPGPVMFFFYIYFFARAQGCRLISSVRREREGESTAH